MTSKHYDEKQALEILEKMKTIDMENVEDSRIENPDNGVLFERSMINYDILNSLSTGVKSKCKLKYGGLKWEFRLLSVLEYASIDEAVHKFIKSKFKKEMSLEVQGHIRMAVILNRAMTSCPEAEDAILTVDDLIHMDLNAFVGLYREYHVFVEKCDLNLDDMTDEDFFLVLDSLEKKQITYRELSHRILARLAHFYSRYYKLATQLTDNSPMHSSVDTGTIKS